MPLPSVVTTKLPSVILGIQLKFYYIRDLVYRGVIAPHHVPSVEMTADIFTKPLGRVQFELFRHQLGVVPLRSSPKGTK